MSDNPIIPIACNLAAIPLDKRDEHQQNTERVFQHVIDTQELPDGYAFRFAEDADILLALATFVEYERFCCPFFTFTIKVEAANGPLWLYLTGDEGVKEFIQAQFFN